MTNTKAKPFLRWAGGKRWLLKEIDKFVNINQFNTYHEPFIGGGSVFFHLNPKNAFISDFNSELINTYIQVKENLEFIIKFLLEFENTENFYYKIRQQKSNDEIYEAAKFIFLNQTSYNGIFRVNQKGEYNVPYGHRKNLNFDFENLRNVSNSLKNININSVDFSKTLKNIKKGDLVFLAPPYTVAHNKNGFIQYNQKIFSLKDQHRLKEFIYNLKEIGAFYIMTNAAHDAVKEIFFNEDRMFELERASLIGGKFAKRDKYSELVLTNIM